MSARRLLVPLLIGATLLAGGCKNSSTSSGGLAPPPATGAATTTAAPPVGSSPQASVGGSGCPTSNTTSFAKTKFLLHTGLAFGAFHRYLYKPYRAGSFSSGSRLGRIVVFAKAGAAALFIKREVRLAIVDVRANPTLCSALAAPLTRLGDGVNAAMSKLKGGDPAGIQESEQAVSGIESTASTGGAPVIEDPTAKVG